MISTSSESVLYEEEFSKDWDYIITAYNPKTFEVWELWNISGRAAAYNVKSGNWVVLNKQSKWEPIGNSTDTPPDDVTTYASALPTSFWLYLNGEWTSRFGRASNDEVVIKTADKVRN